MAFEEYHGTAAIARRSEPSVRLGRLGQLSLTGAAYNLLGRPEFVVLAFDRERRCIALRPASAREPGARRVTCKVRTSQGGAVTCIGFFKAFRITLDSVRFTPSMEGDWLSFGPVAVEPGVSDVRQMLARANGR